MQYLRKWLLARKWLLYILIFSAGWVFLHTALCCTYGLCDNFDKYDVIIVFGNKVNVDGSLSTRLKSRLDRARELYTRDNSAKVLVSGGLGWEGHEEAVVMRQYLLDCGLPDSSVIADLNGYNTYMTATNAKRIMREGNMKRAVLVTHYYHAARAELAFRSFGMKAVSHGCARLQPEWIEPFSLIREFVAYYYYLFRPYDE